MKPVAIVGGGLSAAFAALACRELGVEADVLVTAFPKISPIGLLLIHALPKTLLSEVSGPYPLDMYAVGNENDYIVKQWGPEYVAQHPRSGRFGELPKHWSVWDPRDVWEALWAASMPRFITGPMLGDAELAELADRYSYVFHTFPSQRSKGQQPIPRTYGIIEWPIGSLSGKSFPHATAVYNGMLDVPWTRMFVGFNKVSVEFTIQATARLEKGSFVPVRINHPLTQPWTMPIHDRVIPLGRWATWDHSKLSHDAYMDVIRVFHPEAPTTEFLVTGEETHDR